MEVGVLPVLLADALGAAGKPLLRVHTAGSVGGSQYFSMWVVASAPVSGS
jgi:hypothetical protein